MTPTQRTIVQNGAQIDTEVYRDVLSYFIKESGHPGCAGLTCIQGNYQFFETDQSHVGGVIDHARSMGVAQNMYVMLCGQMTPAQRIIVRNRARIDTEVYRDGRTL